MVYICIKDQLPVEVKHYFCPVRNITAGHQTTV